MADQLHFPCASCGGKLEFSPGQESLECVYCGHEQPIPAGGAPIVEHSFDEALAGANQVATTAMASGSQEMQCSNCGAISIVTGQADRCAFCDSPVVLHEQAGTMIAPESVLPFKIEQKEAARIFKEWVSSRWFAPSDLSFRAQKKGMDGVYLPYWTYDSDTSTRYRGERGEHYYVEETYTDSEGNEKTRQVRKTRWHSTRGSVRRTFDDVLICASESLPQKLFNGLEPWDLGDLKPYNEAFLSGFAAERYKIDLEGGFGLAKEKMVKVIRDDVKRDIGGDEQRVHNMDTRYGAVTFKHLLLPLWLSSFRYGDDIYRFVVNARTGAANGERPYSAIKIALAVIAAIIVIGIIIAVINMGGK